MTKKLDPTATVLLIPMATVTAMVMEHQASEAVFLSSMAPPLTQFYCKKTPALMDSWRHVQLRL